jgi:hypothetical protein
MDRADGDLLLAYDGQLRTEAEVAGASSVTRLGPLYLASLPGGAGFVTYRDLAGADAWTVRGWVAEVVGHYAGDGAVREVEWKTRGHDHAPGLHQALVDHGFEPREPESVMVGPARALAVDVPLPDGVTVRRIREPAEVRAMSAMTDEAFGDPVSATRADQVLRRLEAADGPQLWIAEAGGAIVCAGRLEPVAGSDFAGIWGGATRADWRGRGVYRALTAARARAALDLGRTLIHSDSTALSRPILERSGLRRVTTTTPYVWRP